MAEETDRIHQGSSGEQTARQRQIIDLIDNEAGLTEQERKLLHVLATAEKTTYRHRRANETGGQNEIEGKNNDGNAITGSFSAAGLLIEAGLVDTKTGEAML